MFPTIGNFHKILSLCLCALFLFTCTLGLICPHDHTSSLDCAACLLIRSISTILSVYLWFVLLAKHFGSENISKIHLTFSLQHLQTLVELKIKLSN